MKDNKRVILMVLDSVGIGEMPDAREFGDVNVNTIDSVSKSSYFAVPHMKSLGLFNIDGVTCGEEVDSPRAAYARLMEASAGKDTTIGHWEIAGVCSGQPLPVYPEGFPKEILDAFSEATGRGVLCNAPYSGTKVIEDYGEEHMRTGDLIVYTSADSVFQIAAHEDIVPPKELYRYCEIAREILVGDLGVGRVIARPFEGEYPFKRTANRHDFSLKPPQKTLLDELKEDGFDVIGVGKINDIFAGCGITEYVYTKNNADGMEKTLQYQKKDFNGLCFVNLVDFDMVYGHRNDVDGYAKAFSEFDSWLPRFIEGMSDRDVLIITADHGCDPGFKGTDHTREYVPFLMYGEKIKPANAGTVDGYTYVSQWVKKLLG